jgi:serine/threonine-protein kinase
MTPQEATTEAARGTSFGKYRLVASVGHGGMAEVYLAIAGGPAGVTKLQVLKRLRRNLTEEPEFLSMFLDEARLAARLNHPNVVQTNEVGQVDNGYFIAMEYLDGQPLNRILHAGKAHPAPPGFYLQILAEALSGLHYAHELTDYDGTPLAIVHRDTSPHNIFVTYEGQTKLVDFGIAKAMRRSTETSVGTIKGKLAYMSPEQARSAAIDRRSDVFVMGLVLWETIAARRVWKGLGELEIITRLVAGDVPRLAEACPGVPPEIVRICERALALKPDDRYPTAAAMRHDILAYLEEARLHVTSEKISAYLSAVFAAKRADMKKIIEQQLSVMAKSPDVTAVSASMAPASLSTSSLVAAPSAPRKSRLGPAGVGALLLGGSFVVALITYVGLGRWGAAPATATIESQAMSATSAVVRGPGRPPPAAPKRAAASADPVH